MLVTPLLAANEQDIWIVAIAIGAGLIVALTAIVTHHLRRLQRDDMEATLKMEMIQRGMSAAEIERVLSARIGSPPPPNTELHTAAAEHRGVHRQA